jgi:hypothetical protein
MSKHALFPLLVLLAVAVTSCDDILETDLSDDMVTLRLPADGITQSDSVAVSFWWEELEGASKYELQIVSPDNINPQSLVLDTLVTKTQFSVSLPAGQYQWCVRGVNSGYKTEFICRTIAITETAPEPPKDVVALRLPANAVELTGPRTVNFSWDAYAGADEYNLLIESPGHQSPETFQLDSTLTRTQCAWELSPGKYEWCVKAIHDGAETDYACRSITIKE